MPVLGVSVVGGVGKPERFTPLKTGVIHMIRVPEEILFRRSA